MIPRRRFLQLAGAGGAALMMPVGTRSAEVALRPEPDLTRLHPEGSELVGVRPHRKGGVRLELGEPLPSATGNKMVVHNYGHSGAGITLSLGCADEAAALVTEARRHASAAGAVAILGSGIIGLTTAAAIRRTQPSVKVTIYAKDLAVESTTSWIAGGQFEPAGLRREHADAASRERLAGWLRTAKAHIQAARPDWQRLGFAIRDNFTLDHDNGGFDEVTPRDVVPKYDRINLPFARLSDPGRLYRTWLLNPRRWLPALVADLRADGVRFVQRRFDDLSDVASLGEPVVVNCTGFGARALWGDEALLPMRGHLVRLVRPSDAHDYFFSGGCQNKVIAYVFCRQDDIVIGGTFVPGDDRPQVHPDDAPVFPGLIANAGRLFAGQPTTCAWWPQR